MAFGNRLINTNAGESSSPFTSATYLRDENVGVYTQSYYAVSDFAYNQNDGLIYSTSRSGVGYWLLSKTDINTNTVTTITSGTSPLYGFRGIAIKDNLLYINESDSNLFSDVRNWTTSGSRGLSFFTIQDGRTMNYNSTTNEFLISIYDAADGYKLKVIKVFDGNTGSYKRDINLQPIVDSAACFCWVDTGGDGVILVIDGTNKILKQLNYDGTDTGLSLDVSSYDRSRGYSAMAFIPTTNELIVSTTNNTEAPRNMARVFQMA